MVSSTCVLTLCPLIVSFIYEHHALWPLQGYHGAAVGKGRQLAKTELEKLKLSELTTREAVLEAARMYGLICPACFRSTDDVLVSP